MVWYFRISQRPDFVLWTLVHQLGWQTSIWSKIAMQLLLASGYQSELVACIYKLNTNLSKVAEKTCQSPRHSPFKETLEFGTRSSLSGSKLFDTGIRERFFIQNWQTTKKLAKLCHHAKTKLVSPHGLNWYYSSNMINTIKFHHKFKSFFFQAPLKFLIHVNGSKYFFL